MVYSFTLGGRTIDDPNYDPFPEQIYIYDNEYRGGGTAPRHRNLMAWHEVAQVNTPNIVWDGLVKDSGETSSIICLGPNTSASFLNLKGGENPEDVSYDPEPHSCTIPRLQKVEFDFPGDD